MLRRISICLMALVVPNVAAGQWTSHRPDGHAPIGVMQDHRHEAGEVMLGYRYMPMMMEGSRDGSTSLTDQEVVDPAGYGFMVTPTEMTMSMHMFGVMWAPTNRITLMGMLPVLKNSMTHLTRAGGNFTTESAGVGDATLLALIGVGGWGNQAAHLNVGVRAPTGSITAEDVLPTSNGQDVQLPYPMQLGSGTWDVEAGATYLGQMDDWSWGAQALGIVRTGDNDRGWHLGNQLKATAWGARRVGRIVSISLRVALASWGDVEGQDAAPSVNPAVVPTARPDLRGGTRFDLGAGINVAVPHAKGLRFAVEVLAPLHQTLHGPQLETDFTVVAGVQVVPVSR